MAIVRFESDKDAAIKLHFVGQKKSTSSGCGSCTSVSNVLPSVEGEGLSERATAVEGHGPLRLAFTLISRRVSFLRGRWCWDSNPRPCTCQTDTLAVICTNAPLH